MKIQTSELTGAALDWAVAKCEKLDAHIDFYLETIHKYATYVDFTSDDCNILYTPSSAWGWGGPIIEREGLTLTHQADRWAAQTDADLFAYGPAPLIAAMRCYVASKLGDTVDIPEELL